MSTETYHSVYFLTLLMVWKMKFLSPKIRTEMQYLCSWKKKIRTKNLQFFRTKGSDKIGTVLCRNLPRFRIKTGRKVVEILPSVCPSQLGRVIYFVYLVTMETLPRY